MNLNYVDGQTPLDEDEKEGLLINSITTKYELDEFEQLNIERATQWAMMRTFRPELVLSENFVKNLHKRMFGEVWKWAGDFRRSDKNIGIDKWQIPVALKALLDDTLYWLNNNVYEPDEMAIRFKHRLVSIHCFSNGNGRHSRLIADILVEKILNKPVFTWGLNQVAEADDLRNSYLKAIKLADTGNIKPLIDFARS